MPQKKKNTNPNLIICGAPAKKVPKPPVSNDDSNKPSILKALEAVVAAGRLGLLGAAAKAAMEAMPDLEVECCNGKVVQETPSSIPLLGEEEEGKEEEKAEKGKKEETAGKHKRKKNRRKKNNSNVAVAPLVKGWSDAKKDIWICGDHVIWLSTTRSQFSQCGLQLGFSISAAFVVWRGIPKMMWDDLLPNLHQLYHQYRFPSIIVIHLGENDLLDDSSSSLVTRMQSDLVILQKAFQNLVIIWSSLLPKGVWKPSEKSQVMETKRNNINCKMGEFCNENGMFYFSHPSLTSENKFLFTFEDTLSNKGTDIFITDLRNVLKTYLDRN